MIQIIGQKLLPNNLKLESCLFGATKVVKNSDKSVCIVDMEHHLVKKVHGVLVMTFLGMLQFLLLIISHHIMLMIATIFF